MKKHFFRYSLLVVVMLFLVLLMPGRAQAAFGAPVVTLQYPPGETSAWGGVTATIGKSGSTTWRATEYRWNGSGDWTCINHADGGTSKVLHFRAPSATTGTPSLNVRLRSTDDCDGGTTSSTTNTTVTFAENNPPIAESCGVNIILVLDESGSIGSSGLYPDIRSGAKDVWDALIGTGSSIGIVEFDTAARKPFGTTYLDVVADDTGSSTDNRDIFYRYIDSTPIASDPNNPEGYGPPSGTNGGWTDWQEALTNASDIHQASAADIIFFFTDGQPTRDESDNGTGTQNYVASATNPANLIKTGNAGTPAPKLYGIAVGSGASTNIAYVTGPNAYVSGSGNVATADYTTSTGGTFGQDLKELVLALCKDSVTVTKETWNETAGAWEKADGWEFTASVTPSNEDFEWQAPQAQTTNPVVGTTGSGTNATGTLLFEWEPANPTTTSNIIIEESGLASQTGYTFVSVACEDNEGAPVSGQPITTNPPTVQSDVAANSFYSCLFRNTEVLLEILKVASADEDAPGDQFTYTITYGNVATADGYASTAYNPVITDQLHDDLKFISYTAPGGTTCTPTGGSGGFGQLITCTGMPDLTEGAPGQIVFTVEVQSANTHAGRQVPNTACVNGETAATGGTALAQKCSTYTITTPVTVAYFAANGAGDGVRFDWETATETGNVGFNIYVETADGPQKVNEELIPSKAIDSLDPQQYSFEAAGIQGNSFYIEDVSLEDVNRMHGPFSIDETHGKQQEKEPIDWASVHIENNVLSADRAAANRAAAEGQIFESALPDVLDRAVDAANELLNKVRGRTSEAVEAGSYPVVDLKVREDGIYRVRFEDIAAAAGSSYNGAPMNQLAVTLQGQPVPLYISDAGGFGVGDYFDFYGEGLDTLYSDTNVYQLQVDASLVKRASVDNARFDRKAKPPSFYMETVEVENNARYTYRASNGDPWYDKVMYTKKGMNFSRELSIDNYVAKAPSILAVDMWGVSDRIEGDDHHVKVSFNGKPAIDSIFDFQDVVNATATIDKADVVNGVNTLTFNVPNDLGADYDMAALEGYSLTYPRRFISVNGQLSFEGADDMFQVFGLDSNNAVVYRLDGEGLTRMGQVKVSKTGDLFRVRFAGNNVNDAYFVSTSAALKVPDIALSVTAANITSGTADLVIISHPNFINGLQPLVAQRQSEGLVVKVVDVEQIYKQYSGGIFDAYAIQEYIAHAIKNMGAKYFLIVGADSRDYHNYTGNDSISFVPTLYASTSSRIHFAPVDPLYTDIDGDGVPDAAIGRFPVHTVAELNAVVGKTLTYQARTDRDSAVFAADTGFEEDSDSFIPDGWSVQKAYIGDGFEDARTTLLAQMNAGTPVASFVGHSDTSFWSFDRLFESSDAAALTNQGKPMVVNQWGCFNTYFVGEAYKTLGDNFLLSGSNGAAAVTGSTTITQATSEQALGSLMMPMMLESGVRIGDAMQEAKSEMSVEYPYLNDVRDVLLGWTIMGDPTLVVAQ